MEYEADTFWWVETEIRKDCIVSIYRLDWSRELSWGYLIKWDQC